VAHEVDVDAHLSVDVLLEGQDHGHPVHDPPDAVDALLPPGPHLGADVVEDRDPRVLGRRGEPEVEIGVVDEDEQIRFFRPEHPAEPEEDAGDEPELRENLREAHDGHLGGAGDEADPLGFEVPTAHAAEGKRRVEGLHLADEVRPVQVSRGLARHDHDGSAMFLMRWHH
jgi:hypothetical protein